MKILQVTAGLDQGGVERGTLEMAAYTVQQGATSLVASNGGRMVEDLIASGAEHRMLPLERRDPLAIFSNALKLRTIILQEKASLVHARSRAPAWAALLACRLTGTPFVTTFHGTHRIQNRLKRLYNSSMVRGIRTIAISGFIKQHIITNYQIPESRIDVAPRGCNPDVFSPEAVDQDVLAELRQSLGIGSTDVVISLPGRLTRWKGQGVFLQAMQQVVDLPWKAVLIGGPGKKTAYLEELKAQAGALGIADRVVFAGDQSDIVPYYAISDIIVSASTEPEAFGRVAVEAQAMGKPVIASAHGGALETVRDGVTGWLFESGNIDDLANKIRHALGSEAERKRMGDSGRQWVMEHFTIEQMCQAEWETYLKVMGSVSGSEIT